MILHLADVSQYQRYVGVIKGCAPYEAAAAVFPPGKAEVMSCRPPPNQTGSVSFDLDMLVPMFGRRGKGLLAARRY